MEQAGAAFLGRSSWRAGGARSAALPTLSGTEGVTVGGMPLHGVEWGGFGLGQGQRLRVESSRRATRRPSRFHQDVSISLRREFPSGRGRPLDGNVMGAAEVFADLPLALVLLDPSAGSQDPSIGASIKSSHWVRPPASGNVPASLSLDQPIRLLWTPRSLVVEMESRWPLQDGR